MDPLSIAIILVWFVARRVRKVSAARRRPATPYGQLRIVR